MAFVSLRVIVLLNEFVTLRMCRICSIISCYSLLQTKSQAIDTACVIDRLIGSLHLALTAAYVTITTLTSIDP